MVVVVVVVVSPPLVVVVVVVVVVGIVGLELEAVLRAGLLRPAVTSLNAEA